MEGSVSDITALLGQAQADRGAKEQLFRVVQERFRKLAAAKMRNERADHTLQGTVLVDDAFLRLLDGQPFMWQNREQFFCAAAQEMRRLLVEHARKKQTAKRDGRIVDLDQAAAMADRTTGDPVDLVALDEVLARLKAEHPEAFKVFDLHYSGQWELKEIAEDILQVSNTTVKRHWAFAKAFLRRELAEDPSNEQ